MTDSLIAINEEVLRQQSRSFAIPILGLDPAFRTPILVQYNLNKSIDTIEDNPNLSLDEKRIYLKLFCESLQSESPSLQLQQQLIPITAEKEAYVFQHHAEIIELYRQLTPIEKAIGKRWTLEMAEGMSIFLDGPIESFDILNTYCYYAAGTVGYYLTDLLKAKRPDLSQAQGLKLSRASQGFACFVQKLNVIRDYYEDAARRGVSFWPQNILNGSTFLEAHYLLCAETLKNDVPKAITYFQAMPSGIECFENFIRFMLSSGLEYLSLLIECPPRPDQDKIKLPKDFILNLYDEVSQPSKEDFHEYCQNRSSEITQQLKREAPHVV